MAKEYGRSMSIICTILKQKEDIKAVNPAKGIIMISKQQCPLHDNMKLLLLWIKEKEMVGDTVIQAII